MLLGALAGCSQPAPAEPIEVPEIVQRADGSSPLEQDPVVQAARRADDAIAIARVTGDLAAPEFVDAVGAEQRRDIRIGITSALGYGDLPVPLGPAVWLPIEIGAPDAAFAAIAPDASTQLSVCLASQSWRASSDEEPSLDLVAGLRSEYLLERVGEDYRLVDEIASSTVCDATGAPIREFSPTPEVPSRVSAESLILPEDG